MAGSLEPSTPDFEKKRQQFGFFFGSIFAAQRPCARTGATCARMGADLSPVDQRAKQLRPLIMYTVVVVIVITSSQPSPKTVNMHVGERARWAGDQKSGSELETARRLH